MGTFLLTQKADGGWTMQRVNTDTEFMDGFRHGFPLEGEPLSPEPENPSSEWQRGFVAGQKEYRPGLSWYPGIDDQNEED